MNDDQKTAGSDMSGNIAAAAVADALGCAVQCDLDPDMILPADYKIGELPGEVVRLSEDRNGVRYIEATIWKNGEVLGVFKYQPTEDLKTITERVKIAVDTNIEEVVAAGASAAFKQAAELMREQQKLTYDNAHGNALTIPAVQIYNNKPELLQK
jgi:hypothetical protein